MDSILQRIYEERETEREELGRIMWEDGLATGHGDTVSDLLKELEWQLKERRELAPPVGWNWEAALHNLIQTLYRNKDRKEVYRVRRTMRELTKERDQLRAALEAVAKAWLEYLDMSSAGRGKDCWEAFATLMDAASEGVRR